MSVRWVSRRLAEAIHYDQIIEHGGLHGIRDEALLDSALSRPRQLDAYAGLDAMPEPERLARLGAAYAVALTRNHPFIDGNKRVAFQVMYVFLGLNGYDLEADEMDVVSAMLALAAGEVPEEAFTEWVMNRMV